MFIWFDALKMVQKLKIKNLKIFDIFVFRILTSIYSYLINVKNQHRVLILGMYNDICFGMFLKSMFKS